MRLNMWNLSNKELLRESAEPGAGGTNTPPAEPPTAPDYSWAPEDFKTEDGYDTEGFRGAYDDLVALKAQNDERLSKIPEDAGAYDFAIPEDIEFGDLELPEGFKVESLAEDEAFKPLYAEFGELLHSIDAPADVAGKAAGLIAKYEATKFAQSIQAGKAELAKVEKAPERVAAAKRALEKRLPEDMATALLGNMNSAAGLLGIEKLLSIGGPKPVIPTPGAANDESLTPAERLKRAREAG